MFSVISVFTFFQDLISKLLVLEPKKRLTAAKALNHPWIRGSAKSEHMEKTQDNLKEFNATRKLKVRIWARKISFLK